LRTAARCDASGRKIIVNGVEEKSAIPVVKTFGAQANGLFVSRLQPVGVSRKKRAGLEITSDRAGDRQSFCFDDPVTSPMTYDRSVVQFCDRQFEDSLSNWPERRQ